MRLGPDSVKSVRNLEQICSGARGRIRFWARLTRKCSNLPAIRTHSQFRVFRFESAACKRRRLLSPAALQAIAEIRQRFITGSVNAFAHLLMPRGIFRQNRAHLTNFGAVQGGCRSVLPSWTDGITEFCSIERPRTVAHQTFPESRHNPEGEVGLTCLSVRCLSSYLFFRQFQ